MTSAQIAHLLFERHPASEGWACFQELADGTGFQKRRTADFVAISTWPSKGYRAIGYEIKVSRGDFLRELQDPTKRQHLEEVCAECWFAAPAGLIKVEELPEGWGLIEVLQGSEEEKLRAKAQARQRTPKPWPMPFMAAIARRCADVEPILPARAWRWAGRDLTLADLRKMLKLLDVRDGTLVRAELQRVQEQLALAREQKKELGLLRAAVVHALGWKAGTAAGFKAAMMNVSANPSSKQRLLALLGEMQTTVEGL